MQDNQPPTAWHSKPARDESDLVAYTFIVTRSLARDGMPGRPREQTPPPAPREVRQRGSGARSGEGLLRSRGRRSGALPGRSDADGRSGREDPSLVGQRAPGQAHSAPPSRRPSGDGRGKSTCSPAILRPPPYLQSPFSRLSRSSPVSVPSFCHRSDRVALAQEGQALGDTLILAGPGGQYGILTVAPSGAVMSVDGDPVDGYCPVTYDGVSGWTSAGLLQVADGGGGGGATVVAAVAAKIAV